MVIVLAVEYLCSPLLIRWLEKFWESSVYVSSFCCRPSNFKFTLKFLIIESGLYVTGNPGFVVWIASYTKLLVFHPLFVWESGVKSVRPISSTDSVQLITQEEGNPGLDLDLELGARLAPHRR